MWAALVLLFSTIGSFVVAVASDPTSSQWAQIGIGALIAMPAYAVVTVLWRDRGRKESEIKNLNDKATSRERELADRIVPLLTEAARVLASAPAQFDQAIKSVTGGSDVDRVLSKLNRVIEDLDPDRGQGNER